MLQAVGLTTNSDCQHWIDALRACRVQQIVSTPFGGSLPHTAVDAWLVVPEQGFSLLPYSPWLAQLRAPVVLVTGRLSAGVQLINTLPQPAIVCHPFRAEQQLSEIMYLAAQLSSGPAMIDVPRVRMVQRGPTLPWC